MKRLIITILVLALLIGAVSVFGVLSYADAVEPSDMAESTISVPDGKDYMFYVQIRDNRMDSTKKDMRIICVASQDWLQTTGEFAVKFTFTDGTTPKTTKALGVSRVFKSVTAYGVNGTVDTYTAADGALLLGWIFTDVPEAYADVVTNVPSIQILTGDDAIPEIEDTTDYVTPVQTMDDIDVETAGVYHNVETTLNGKVGGFDPDDSKATFILSGNYEGVYAMKIWYTSKENRWMSVTVNGVQQMFRVSDEGKTDFWDFDDQHTRDDAKYVIMYFEMKKGANVITFAKCNNAGPNLVDFDLERVGDILEADPIVEAKVPASENEMGNWSFEGGVTIESTKSEDMKLGWITPDNKVIYTLEDVEAGKYLVSVEYLSMDDPNSGYKRALVVTANDSDSVALPCGQTASWDNVDDVFTAEVIVDLAEGANTLTFNGGRNFGGGNAPCMCKITITPIAK